MPPSSRRRHRQQLFVLRFVRVLPQAGRHQHEVVVHFIPQEDLAELRDERAGVEVAGHGCGFDFRPPYLSPCYFGLGGVTAALNSWKTSGPPSTMRRRFSSAFHRLSISSISCLYFFSIPALSSALIAPSFANFAAHARASLPSTLSLTVAASAVDLSFTVVKIPRPVFVIRRSALTTCSYVTSSSCSFCCLFVSPPPSKSTVYAVATKVGIPTSA